MKFADLWNHPECHIMQVDGINVLNVTQRADCVTILLDRNQTIRIEDDEVFKEGDSYFVMKGRKKHIIDIFKMTKITI